jgi:WD40 repeat protein
MPSSTLHLDPCWQTVLPEYITAIAWDPQGKTLAVGTAAGDLVLYGLTAGPPQILQTQCDRSIDRLALSADGQYLAAGGQDGAVRLWHLGDRPTLVQTLQGDRVWVDRLVWHPQRAELAIAFGRSVQVWDVAAQICLATLDGNSSSILDLAWHPTGDFLSVAVHQAIKTWQRQDWTAPPQDRETATAIEAIAWSSDGTYLASGNHDRTLLVWEQGNPAPWQMQGFPGKVRQLAWPTPMLKTPMLASISAEEVILWEKDPDPAVGWTARPLSLHQGRVRAIAFQPGSSWLASAGDDGMIYLWQKAREARLRLQGAPAGFSELAWQPQGQYLAAGGQQGELILWAIAQRGRGFG